jgi:hypothetical protein
LNFAGEIEVLALERRESCSVRFGQFTAADGVATNNQMLAICIERDRIDRRARFVTKLVQPQVFANRLADRVGDVPPAESDASNTSTSMPARARYAAQTSPLCPAPMMITSVITELLGCRIGFPQIAQYFACRVGPRRTHDTTARVGR